MTDARIKVVEFTDFQCPACAGAAEILHKMMQQDGARMFLQLKYFPLDKHKNALKAAVAAECALAQGKFWPMQDAIFSRQKGWATLDDPLPFFVQLGRDIGINDVEMTHCVADAAVAVRVQADVAEGKRLGVSGTPTFFVNGKMAVGGKAFEEALKGVKP